MNCIDQPKTLSCCHVHSLILSYYMHASCTWGHHTSFLIFACSSLIAAFSRFRCDSSIDASALARSSTCAKMQTGVHMYEQQTSCTYIWIWMVTLYERSTKSALLRETSPLSIQPSRPLSSRPSAWPRVPLWFRAVLGAPPPWPPSEPPLSWPSPDHERAIRGREKKLLI